MTGVPSKRGVHNLEKVDCERDPVIPDRPSATNKCHSAQYVFSCPLDLGLFFQRFFSCKMFASDCLLAVRRTSELSVSP